MTHNYEIVRDVFLSFLRRWLPTFSQVFVCVCVCADMCVCVNLCVKKESCLCNIKRFENISAMHHCKFLRRFHVIFNIIETWKKKS